jgi:hypothetical protein
MVIQINFKHCKDNHLTTWHLRVMKTPRVATFHDAIKESGQVLPHPSARLPYDTSTGICGWPMHYPGIHHVGMIGYHPTQWPTKLLCLWDTINPGPSDRSLIDSSGAYHIRSSKHDNRPLPDLSIRYSTLSPSCSTRSHFCAINQSLHINHIGPPSEERALSQAVFDQSSSTDSLHN